MLNVYFLINFSMIINFYKLVLIFILLNYKYYIIFLYRLGFFRLIRFTSQIVILYDYIIIGFGFINDLSIVGD